MAVAERFRGGPFLSINFGGADENPCEEDENSTEDDCRSNTRANSSTESRDASNGGEKHNPR